MMQKLRDLKPERVFYYFEEITKIPRCSGSEKQISDYLKKVGEDLGLKVIQDELNNIIIKKPATKGYENSEGIILQGHMDMVCEKEEQVDHDFSTDSIDLIVEDGFIKANGTTLGADNGIAVAMGLAILEDDRLEHPMLELLITTSEETDMSGALGLKPNVLKGTRLLNLDSEEEGFLTVGSAGGELIKATVSTEEESVSGYQALTISVTGLNGGHSGMEIDKNRANALKVSLNILKTLQEEIAIKLVSIDGGTKDNAIPRQIKIVIGVKEEDLEKLEASVTKIETQLKNKWVEENPQILLDKPTGLQKALRQIDLENILYLLEQLPTGVHTWLADSENTVESSSNLAIVHTEKGKITLSISTRSSSERILNAMREQITKDIEKVGSFHISGGYPEWEYKVDSKLREKAVELYQKMYGTEMKVIVIHAGLESGALKKTYPNLDVVSFGPDMFDVHTPKEKLSIASTKRSYEYLVELLKGLK